MVFKPTKECYYTDVQQVAIALLEAVIEKNIPITYKNLSEKLHNAISPRNLGIPLGKFSNACKENGVPLISAVVINSGSNSPGNGFYTEFFGKVAKDRKEQIFIEEYNKVKNFEYWNVVLDSMRAL